MKQSKHFQRLYRKSPLLLKLNATILAITLLLCSLLLAFILFFYHFTVTRQRESNAAASAQRAAESLNQNTRDILQHFIRICGSKDFLSELSLIAAQPEDVYLHRQNLDSTSNELARSHFLISSVLIISGAEPHQAYPSYSTPLRMPLSSVFTDEELRQLSGITWFSERQEPSNPSQQVIPLVIPVSNYYNLSYISDGSTAPDAFVVLFLDSEKLRFSLATAGLDDQKLSYHLVTGSGALISDMNTTFPEVPPDTFSSLIAELNDSGLNSLIWQNHGWALMLHRLQTPDLFLFCDLERETLGDILLNTGSSLLVALSMILVLMLAISFFMHRFVTRPIGKLSDIVQSIKKGSYTTPVRFDTGDELGQLLEAINSMNATICTQKQQIKADEAAKYQTELKLQTAQINPHFLYNTLEEIQSEVVRSNNTTAASMIQYLAEYLRITLSGGADVISINNELRHVNAYIRIMNQRFGQSILFLHRVDPQLSEGRILKTILQPLVENAIRHGFGIDSAGIPVSVPTIEISFTQPEEGVMQIDVSDNGSGFDAEAVRAAMLADQKNDPRRHIGVNNVYHRLITCYGRENVEVSMESIPYYQNVIRLRIRTGGTAEGKTGGQNGSSQ